MATHGCLWCVASLALLLLPVPPLSAETVITVTTVVDDRIPNGNCTLREAVIAANTDAPVDLCPAGSGADRIVLPAGRYVLSLTGSREDQALAGDLDVTGGLVLLGAGAEETIIDGGSFGDPDADRVFHVQSHGDVALSGVTITGGRCTGGGGIYNAGFVSVRFSRIEGNIVSPYVYEGCRNPGTFMGGAGIYNAGQLLLIRSTLTGNAVHGTFASDVDTPGGALLNHGLATIDGSILTLNFAAAGGGIENSGGLHVFASEISDNGARFYGAGLRNLGFAVVRSTTVSGNVDGGIINWGDLSLQNSTVSGNRSLRIPGSVLSMGAGSAKIVNSTIVHNFSNYGGGGVSGTAYLANTIVANNDSGDCVNAVVSWGHNLDSDGSCGLGDATDLQGLNPQVGPLGDNGGPTETHALLPGSPAIDQVPVAQCRLGRLAGADQRGVARPQPADGACDIGSFELEYAEVPD